MSNFGIDRLPIADRLRLVREICDTLEEPHDDFVMTDELRAELDRRIALMDAHPESLRPWADVEARLRAGLKQ
jgi:putative addiction module component (TIGR02574 family)